MDDHTLIKLVETHDIIYNRRHHLYKNQDKKEGAFVEIAAEMEISDVQIVIQRYRTLRDRFTRYKRIKMATGEVKHYLPVLDKMEFLTPHIFNKKRSKKCGNKSRDDAIARESDGSNSLDPLQVSLSSTHDESEADMDMSFSSPDKSSEPNRSKRIKREFMSSNDQIIDNKTDCDVAFCEAITNFKKISKLREQREENSALHGFRQMIIATISKMNPHKQTKAMLLVTEAVMKIKMEDDD